MEQNNIDNDPHDYESEPEPYIITNTNIKVPKKQATTSEILALILGAFSVATILLIVVPLIFAIPGLILLSNSKYKTKRLSNIGKIGLVCCICVTAFDALVLLIGIIDMFSRPWIGG